ncbi:MAG: hypothetical protein Q4Q62_08600 [Thermoplasmata archaeon]|nr:hypothetical protein [Thermoplasmata archaeon]
MSYFLLGNAVILCLAGIAVLLLVRHGIRSFERSEGRPSAEPPSYLVEQADPNVTVEFDNFFLQSTGTNLVVDGKAVCHVNRGNVVRLRLEPGTHRFSVSDSGEEGAYAVDIDVEDGGMLHAWRDERCAWHVTGEPGAPYREPKEPAMFERSDIYIVAAIAILSVFLIRDLLP